MPDKIIIAVDFGTTFSAVGYAKCNVNAKCRDIALHVIQEGWPGQSRQRSPKVPTLFKFEDDRFKYGFEVQDDDDRIAFSKLFLDPYQLDFAVELGRCTNVKEVRQLERLTHGVSEYLRALREQALHHMIHVSKWSKTYVNLTPKEYVLSVPAIWSDSARAKTLDCAYRAGYGMRFSPESITLVAEPEAAAAYTITTQPSKSFPVGETFIVCDAGGGTVDLSAYKVARSMPDLELEEVAISNGDLCGSVFLDREFLVHVEKRIGRLPEESIQGVLSDFRDNIKMNFTGEDDEDYQVYIDSSIPDKPESGFENGTLVVTSDEVRAIFDQIIGQILVLLTQHMSDVRRTSYNKPISILLVGGFGSNFYLKKRIDEEFPQSDVIQPPDSWSAIIKGSLMRGMIKRRKMRCAYGVAFRKTWDASLDTRPQRFKEEYQVWDENERKTFCINCMEWYVKKGEEFTDTKTVSFPFYRNVGLHHSMKFEDILYVYMNGVDGDAGPEFKDADCKPLAKLTTDLNVIDNLRQRLERSGHLVKKKDSSYYKIYYQLVMVFDSQINFFLEYDGVCSSQIEIEYVEPGVGTGTKA